MVLTLLAVCLAVTGAGDPGLGKSGPIIEGGKGVGGFELGRRFSPYSRRLGPPTKVKSSEDSNDAQLFYYRKYGMYFFVKRDILNGIEVESPLFATPEGIRVGSNREQVLAVYGEPQALRVNDVAYPERGLSFSFMAGKVSRIYVVDKEERDLASGDMRIVPGIRVGGLQVGQSVEFVLKQWKNPSKRQPFPNKKGSELWAYGKQGIVIVVYGGRIDGILVESGAFHTIRDIRVGSKRAVVVDAYGNPQTREENMEAYPRNGMAFFYKNGSVERIYIKEPSDKM